MPQYETDTLLGAAALMTLVAVSQQPCETEEERSLCDCAALAITYVVQFHGVRSTDD